MTTSEFETLRTELLALRADVDQHFAQVEAKLDSKPGLMAMFTGIVVVVFGMAGVIASTIASLHSLGFIR
jgi:hypothetical protein